MEQLTQTESIDDLFKQIIDNEPKFVTNYVPEKLSATQQKADFIAGNIRNPNHLYDRLDNVDFEKATTSIELTGRCLLGHAGLDPRQIPAYEEFIEGYLKKTRLMELAHEFKQAEDTDEKSRLKDEYMRLNIELYGEPDKTTYESLLQEKLHKIAQKDIGEGGAHIRNELFDMLDYTPGANQPERFKPSDSTVEWMHGAAEALYGDMLSRVPDKTMFTNQEVATIFTEIIEQEFGDSALGWRVDIEDADSINVKASEKRIVIPKDRADISIDGLKGLVVHELGVHMLRSIIGGETDLLPLSTGLNDYYDAEEGLGVVMEQSLKGKFSERGVDHYITAGLAYFNEKDFRDIFEVKWRLSVLGLLADNADVTDEMIIKAKNSAYGGVMRSLRGTDELPWFKDLAYYNGAMDVWKHLEDINGDDLKFMFVLMGKANPANQQHERILLETRTA